MSSDSSDNEDLEKLREAADSRFINDGMFNKNKESKPKPDQKPSLRPNRDEDKQFNTGTTPEFRNYIAKHLSTLLDGSLRYITNNDTPIKPKRRKSGIKLLKTSPHYVKVKDSSVKLKKPVVSDESDNDDKFRSVSVNPDDILSQKETKHWSVRSKAPIYEYYKTENGLILK